jgi:carboxymethylenebutenolidase
MAGKWITIGAGAAKFRAYMAVPEGGKGPCLLLLQDAFGVNAHMRDAADRFAEEGYVVVAPDLSWRLQPRIELGFDEADTRRARDLERRFDVEKALKDITATLAAVRRMRRVTGKTGVLGFGFGGLLACLAAARSRIDAAVGYDAVGIDKRLAEAGRIRCPILLHYGEADERNPRAAVARVRKALAKHADAALHAYPGAGHGFANPGRAGFDRAAAGMAHSRTIGLLRGAIGPRYDLPTLWERHTFLEFGARDVGATMKTMVSQPYVNHIPTLTGGVGHDELARFYKYHFIPKCPRDTRLVPVSRTVGADRVVDEMLFCFTHDIEIDWMLPGVPPTGRYVEVPLVAIVNFRGPRLYHEHIYWDQASVLVQIGLLDPALLPVSGHEQAKKLLDETLPSNALMRRWRESAGKSAP